MAKTRQMLRWHLVAVPEVTSPCLLFNARIHTLKPGEKLNLKETLSLAQVMAFARQGIDYEAEISFEIHQPQNVHIIRGDTDGVTLSRWICFKRKYCGGTVASIHNHPRTQNDPPGPSPYDQRLIKRMEGIGLVLGSAGLTLFYKSGMPWWRLLAATSILILSCSGQLHSMFHLVRGTDPVYYHAALYSFYAMFVVAFPLLLFPNYWVSHGYTWEALAQKYPPETPVADLVKALMAEQRHKKFIF